MKRFSLWLKTQRASTRLSFLLQIACRVGSSLLSLLWARLLLISMGKSLTGSFLNFQSITTLGTLGDFGMGGLVNIRVSRLLGQRDEGALKNFLAGARGIFLAGTVLVVVIFWGVSPWLFHALQFDKDPQTGFLPMLSLVGGAAIALLVLNSYINNVNYGVANLVWPVVPSLLILQLGILGHWLLARQQAALWVQYTPYVLASVLIQVTGWWYLKYSHPSLATITPLRFNWKQFADLSENSFWIYLDNVGTGIWVATDAFLITVRFGPEIIPAYKYNFKLCELALFVLNSACLAALPKIALWLASPERPTREHGIREVLRLNRFQTFLGCSAALVYLTINDSFMRFWMRGQNLQVPLLWQIAFAAVLAITGAGLMPNYVALRCGDRGIRLTGVVALLCALLNFGLSFVAMELSPVLGMKFSIFGIAFATVIAASVKFLYLGRFCAREFGISSWTLIINNWLLALGAVSFAILIRCVVPQTGVANITMLIVIQLIAILIIGRAAGLGLKDLQEEKRIFQAIFQSEKGDQPY